MSLVVPQRISEQSLPVPHVVTVFVECDSLGALDRLADQDEVRPRRSTEASHRPRRNEALVRLLTRKEEHERRDGRGALLGPRHLLHERMKELEVTRELEALRLVVVG